MNIDNNTALVLEGGGMRGMFTIGVLDAFMEAGLTFPYVVGVSAGACNGSSYVTNQKGRAYFSNIGMLKKYGKDYLGIRMLLRTGNLLNVPLLYDELPNKIWPFDFETYISTPTVFETVTTNLNNGKAEYFSNHAIANRQIANEASRKLIMSIVLASSSLPYVSRTVNIEGTPMLDGGVVDSIPLGRAMSQGYEKNVVILTRNAGYRKKIRHGLVLDFLSAMLRFVMYPRFPHFRHALSMRGKVYNEQLELVDKLEKEGKILVIRPERPIEVDRIERNTSKLQRLYEEGFEVGKRFCEEHFSNKASI